MLTRVFPNSQCALVIEQELHVSIKFPSAEGAICLANVHAQLLSLIQLLRNPMDCSPPGSSVHGISQT